MEAKLSVEIGANVSGLAKGMADAAKITQQGVDRINKPVKEIPRAFALLNNAKFTFGQNFQRSAIQATNSVNQLDNAVKKSRGNMQAWLYIIQDAPFGLMGIQNNLTQLIPGVGAASLAFSALISALTFSQVGMTYWNKGAKQTAKEAKDVKEALDEYAEGLDVVDKARVEGSKSSSKELAEINALRTAIESESIPREKRLNAIKQLKEEYPSYFKGMNTEDLLLGKVSGSYQKLTRDILAAGKARSAINLQAEEYDKINILDIKREKRQETINRLIREQSTLQAEIQSKGGDLARVTDEQAENASNILDYLPLQGNEIDKLNTKYVKNQGIISKLRSEAVDDFKNQQDAYKNIEALQKNIIADGGIEVKQAEEKAEKYNRIKTESLEINKILKEENAEREKGLKLITEYLNKQSGADGANAKKLTDSVLPGMPKISSPESINIPIVSELDLAIMRIGEQAGELKNNIAPLLTDAFYSLGEAMNSGDFSGFGEGLLRAMSGFIADLGQMFIKEGIMQIAAGIAKNVALPGSGINNIVSGKMLIAAGALGALAGGVVGSTSMGSSSPGYQIPKFAGGVTGFSGGMALVGERGPELVTLPTGSNVITNQNVGKLARSNGGGTSTIIPDVRISGQDLVVVFDRASKSRNRVT